MQALSYYQRNRTRILMNLRRTRLTTRDGVVLHGLNKRPYPTACELCKDAVLKRPKTQRLSYHHWDDKNPNKGLWLCPTCHFIAEFLDTPEAMEIFALYTALKEAIDESHADGNEPDTSHFK